MEWSQNIIPRKQLKIERLKESGHYYNDYYVIKMPGHILLPPDKFKRSLRPMSEYVQQDIYSTELDKKDISKP